VSDKTKLILIISGSVVLLALAGFFIFKIVNSHKTQTIAPVVNNISDLQKTSTTTIPQAVDMSNPASVNCINKGGNLVIQTNSAGGQYGLCYFQDNYACEEWAMMNGACPVGGVKTTGFVTDAQKYCAWVGGQTTTADNAICTFKDKSVCSLNDLFNGNCQTGNYKIEKVLSQTCSQSSDCQTPASYLTQNRCAFASQCLGGKCTVVCPQFK